MPNAKIVKHCLFSFLYAVLVFEIVWTSGLFDPRILIWPKTPGTLIGVRMSGKFFASYGYQYQVQGKILEGWQILPLFYKDSLTDRQIITVCYDKNDPDRSFVEPGFNKAVAFVVLFVMLLGVFLLIIPALSWRAAFLARQEK